MAWVNWLTFFVTFSLKAFLFNVFFGFRMTTPAQGLQWSQPKGIPVTTVGGMVISDHGNPYLAAITAVPAVRLDLQLMLGSLAPALKRIPASRIGID